MLTDRILADGSSRDAWKEARYSVIGASDAAYLSKPESVHLYLASKLKRDVFTGNVFTENGYRFEPMILGWAGYEHNTALIHAHDEPGFAATPDGMSVDHRTLAEAKTTGKDWNTPPIKYVRQCQWQMHVTGAERCLLVWNLRVPDEHGWFYLGWIEPKTKWIDRDDAEIAKLVTVADRLLEAVSA